MINAIVFGAPRIAYEPLQGEPGVRLLTPASPDFRPRLERHSTAAELDRIITVLPYAVLVHNTTDQRIVSFVVRYQVKNSFGQPVWWTFRHQSATLSDGDKHLLPSNESFFVSPVKMLNRAITHGSSSRLPNSALTTGISRALAMFSRQEAIRVVLDSVLFEDGRFVGADTAGNYRIHAGEYRAESFFKEAIRTLTGNELRAFLKAQELVPDLELPVTEMSEQQHYQTRLKELSLTMVSALSTKPESEVRSHAALSLPIYPKPLVSKSRSEPEGHS